MFVGKRVKNISVVAVAMFLFFEVFSPANLSAAQNGTIDYSHSRILAIGFSSKTAPEPVANGSGYLYAPRIVLTAGHFQEWPKDAKIFAFQNNSQLTSKTAYSQVIKAFYPDSYVSKSNSNDFAIFVLEKPLAQVLDARLITPEIFKSLIDAKTPLNVTGYGVYEDVCKLLNQKPRCDMSSNLVHTSLEPRNIQMTPITQAEILRKYGNGFPDILKLEDHLFMQSNYETSPCPGDSGGATTVSVDGAEYYVGTTPAGFWSGYNCGATPDGGLQETIGYTAPVFKFLDLIKEAQDFVKANPIVSPTPTPTPSLTSKPGVKINTSTKSFISCIKGKVTIKVSSARGLCPNGYKKK